MSESGQRPLIKPPALRPGDAVGIVSPAWGGAGLFPHRVEQATQHLTRLGYRVKVGAHARHQHGHVSDTAANRVADLHAMFQDPEVRLIVAAIGGDHANHLLPRLDFDLIRAHPTAFIGYSDMTVLNVAIWQQTGLVTFNGPMILTDFGEQPQMFEYTEAYFLKAVTRAEPIGRVEPSPWWTEEFLNWEEKADRERPRERLPSPGWRWLQGGVGQGPLIGGCLESLDHLRGTRFWPDWEGAIFFWETSEEKPPPARVDSLLMDYDNMGVLARLQGMVVGRPMYYSDEEKTELRQVIAHRLRAYNMPIVTDTDFGHTAPQFTLPLGCQARLDGDQQTLEIIESATQ